MGSEGRRMKAKFRDQGIYLSDATPALNRSERIEQTWYRSWIAPCSPFSPSPPLMCTLEICANMHESLQPCLQTHRGLALPPVALSA